MKNILLPVFILIMITVPACKKNDNPPEVIGNNNTQAKANIEIQSIAIHDDLVLGDTYLNANGDSVRFTNSRYWLSNVTFIKEDGSKWAENNSYRLMEKTSANKRESFEVKGLPPGRYKSIRFSIGVDPDHNSSLDSIKGELDATIDMSWTWATGYIFLKAEGTYYNVDSMKYKNWAYHVGTDANYKTITLDLPAVYEVKGGKTLDLHIIADMLKMFGPTPNLMVVKDNPIIMGPGTVATQVAENYAGMFEMHHASVK